MKREKCLAMRVLALPLATEVFRLFLGGDEEGPPPLSCLKKSTFLYSVSLIMLPREERGSALKWFIDKRLSVAISDLCLKCMAFCILCVRYSLLMSVPMPIVEDSPRETPINSEEAKLSPVWLSLWAEDLRAKRCFFKIESHCDCSSLNMFEVVEVITLVVEVVVL